MENRAFFSEVPGVHSSLRNLPCFVGKAQHSLSFHHSSCSMTHHVSKAWCSAIHLELPQRDAREEAGPQMWLWQTAKTPQVPKYLQKKGDEEFRFIHYRVSPRSKPSNRVRTRNVCMCVLDMTSESFKGLWFLLLLTFDPVIVSSSLVVLKKELSMPALWWAQFFSKAFPKILWEPHAFLHF